MAFITRDFYDVLRKNKLIEHGDWEKMAQMGREVGLNKGKGFNSRTYRNAITKGFTTTDEVVEIIEAFYSPKVDAISRQRAAIKEMKKKLSAL